MKNLNQRINLVMTTIKKKMKTKTKKEMESLKKKKKATEDDLRRLKQKWERKK